MLVIPNIIDLRSPSEGRSENVEVERFGEPVVRIMRSLSCGHHGEAHALTRFGEKDSGNGFYYLCAYCAAASAILAYARDFMVDRGLPTIFRRL